MPANVPDLVLEGHEAVADYALAWSPVAPIIASGGKDKKILLWNIESFLQQKGIIDEDSSNSEKSHNHWDEDESDPLESDEENEPQSRQSKNVQGNESGDEEAKYGEKMDIDSS